MAKKTVQKVNDTKDMAIGMATRLSLALDKIPGVPDGHGRISAAAELFGESHQTLRLWLNAKDNGKVGMPSLKKIESIAEILDVCIEWLLTGKGPMYRGQKYDENQLINKKYAAIAMRYIHQNLTKKGFFKLAENKQEDLLLIVTKLVERKSGKLSNNFIKIIEDILETYQ